MIKSLAVLLEDAKEKVNCLNASEAHQLYTHTRDVKAHEVLLLDVREAETAAESKLTQSINIPRGLVEMKIEKQCSDSEQLIMVHCAAGGRATLCALTLQNMGYSNVYAIVDQYNQIKSLFD